MQIGTKIRLLRLKHNLTQEELADRCELSKSFISQLENDYTSPSIVTLEDIVSALGTTLKQFFSDMDDEKIVFTDNDYCQRQDEESTVTWLITNSQKNEMEPILVELKPNGTTDSDMPHEGEEFGYVLDGELQLVIGDRTLVCKKGDSFYFTADEVHYIKNASKENTKFIWVSSPPNF
jgi:transcriptional regulator with XRE-family HTH domain